MRSSASAAQTLPTLTAPPTAPILQSCCADQTTTTASDPGYISGQEPKSWAPPSAASGDLSASLRPSSDGLMDIVFPPEMAPERPLPAEAASAPKATELAEEPASLEKAVVEKSQPSKKTDEPKVRSTGLLRLYQHFW